MHTVLSWQSRMIYTCMHIYIQTYIRAHTQTYIYMIDRQTNIHTYMYLHTCVMYVCLYVFNNESGILIVKNAIFSFCPRDSKMISILTVVILKIKLFIGHHWFKLLELSLKGNDFEFNWEMYHQVCGCAMKKRFSPNYASIYVSE